MKAWELRLKIVGWIQQCKEMERQVYRGEKTPWPLWQIHDGVLMLNNWLYEIQDLNHEVVDYDTSKFMVLQNHHAQNAITDQVHRRNHEHE